MFISKIREDGVFLELVEVPDDTTKLTQGFSFSIPPTFPESSYAILRGKWYIIEGVAPSYPAIPEGPVPPTPEELQQSIVNSTQQRLDQFARTRNYDGILSACTYAVGTDPKFQQEGQYCVEAREATWAKLYEILAEVTAGARTPPSSFSDIESDLPVLEWPN